MDKKLLSIDEVKELLKQWSGKQIKIVKHEMNDLDEALIDLKNISYQQETQTIDDYEARNSLHLNGAGMIETTEDNYQELPSDLYEIPLEEDALYESDGKKLMVSTSRGVYVLELMEG